MDMAEDQTKIALDYLSKHVIILGLPKNVKIFELWTMFECEEKPATIRLISDPTFYDCSAMLILFQNPIEANTVATRISMMGRESGYMALNAATYLKTCAQHLPENSCETTNHRVVVTGLRYEAEDILYITLFAKFGDINQCNFLNIEDDHGLIVEYSCAVECLAAELALSQMLLKDTVIKMRRVPNPYFLVPGMIRSDSSSKSGEPDSESESDTPLPGESEPESDSVPRGKMGNRKGQRKKATRRQKQKSNHRSRKSNYASEKPNYEYEKSDNRSEISSRVTWKSNLVSEKSNLVFEKSNLVSEKSNLVSEKSNLVSEKSNLVSEKSNHVSEKSNHVSETSNHVSDMFHRESGKSNHGSEIASHGSEIASHGSEKFNRILEKSNCVSEKSNDVPEKSNLVYEKSNHGSEKFHTSEISSRGSRKFNQGPEKSNHVPEKSNHGPEKSNHGPDKSNHVSRKSIHASEKCNHVSEKCNHESEKFNHGSEKTQLLSTCFNLQEIQQELDKLPNVTEEDISQLRELSNDILSFNGPENLLDLKSIQELTEEVLRASMLSRNVLDRYDRMRDLAVAHVSKEDNSDTKFLSKEDIGLIGDQARIVSLVQKDSQSVSSRFHELAKSTMNAILSAKKQFVVLMVMILRIVT